MSAPSIFTEALIMILQTWKSKFLTTRVRIRDLFFISMQLKTMETLKILSMQGYFKQVEKVPG